MIRPPRPGGRKRRGIVAAERPPSRVFQDAFRLFPRRFWLLGLVASALMVVSEFTTLREVQVLTASCADLADPELRSVVRDQGRRGTLVRARAAGNRGGGDVLGRVRGPRPGRGGALAAIGVAVLAIALVTDVPNAGSTGVLGERFEEANAQAGAGLWMEIVGGALAVVVGVGSGVAAMKLGPARAQDQRR